jgi:hypothetical protein
MKTSIECILSCSVTNNSRRTSDWKNIRLLDFAEDLEMRKTCAKIVPKLLTLEHKMRRKQCCIDWKDLEERDAFLETVITGDELWIYSNRQRCSKAWRKTTFKGASTNGNGGGTSALRLKGTKIMYPIIRKIQILWTQSRNFLNRPRIPLNRLRGLSRRIHACGGKHNIKATCKGKNSIEIEVLTMVTVNSTVFYSLTPCSSARAIRRFAGMYRLHLQARRVG